MSLFCKPGKTCLLTSENCNPICFCSFFFLIHSLCFLPPPPIQDRAGREVAGLPAFTEEVLPTETFAHDDTESVRTIQLGLVSVGHRERRLKDVLNLK